MTDILFASNNKGKYYELVNDFNAVGINLIYDGTLDLKESAKTLKDISKEKARQAVEQKHMMTLSDDSGVFIEVLDYFPGVYSRRWAGEPQDDKFRNEAILDRMQNEKERTAYLISRFTLMDTDFSILGTYAVKNKFTVSYEEKGEHGFGYDKILIPSDDMINNYMGLCPAYSREDYQYAIWGNLANRILDNQMTIAELTQKEKNLICNRGRIAAEVKQDLEDMKGTL